MTGCSGVSPPPCCIGMQKDVLIKYVNEKGENLLNPDHLHAITMQNTDVYYLINGKKKKPDVGLDNPKGFHIIQGFDTTGVYLMQLYANTLLNQNTATTYITFKEYPTDTLKVKYDNSNGVTVYKTWYNGNLRMDQSIFQRNKSKVIVVTKHLSEK